MKTRLIVLGFLAGLSPTLLEAQRVFSLRNEALTQEMQELGRQLLDYLPLSPMLLLGILILVTGIWISYFREAWIHRRDLLSRHSVSGAASLKVELESRQFSAPSGGRRIAEFQGREERTRLKAAKNQPPLAAPARRRQPEAAG